MRQGRWRQAATRCWRRCATGRSTSGHWSWPTDLVCPDTTTSLPTSSRPCSSACTWIRGTAIRSWRHLPWGERRGGAHRPAQDGRGGQRTREDRLHFEHARPVGLRPDPRWRNPCILDHRQRLHHSCGYRELDSRSRGRDARQFHPSSMKRFLGAVVVIAAIAAAAWFYVNRRQEQAGAPALVRANVDYRWLDKLYSPNPGEVEAAMREVTRRGAAALPVIQAALRDSHAEADRLKGALKACTILGRTAAPAIPD